MKKYYCPTCKQFKSRWQIQRTDDTRTVFFTCKWCHNSNIYTTKDVISKLIDKTLSKNDFSNRHGSYL
jgi:RNase P subunit RPR2